MKLYFVKEGEYVKVGIASNLEDRLQTMQVNSPREQELISCVEGQKGFIQSVEKEIQNRLGDKNKKQGSWYEICEESFAKIAQVLEENFFPPYSDQKDESAIETAKKLKKVMT